MHVPPSRACPLPACPSPTRREPSAFRGTQGTALVGVFDMTCASTGASEKTLKRVRVPYEKVHACVGAAASTRTCTRTLKGTSDRFAARALPCKPDRPPARPLAHPMSCHLSTLRRSMCT